MTDGDLDVTVQDVVLVEPLGLGGVAEYTGALATGLDRLGHRVAIVTSTDHRLSVPDGVAVKPLVVWARDRTRLERFARRAKLSPALNALRFVQTVPRVVRLAGRGGVIHLQGTYFPPLFALLAAAARASGVAVVYTPHNLFVRGRAQFGHSRGLVLRCAAAVILHLGAEVSQLPRWAARRARVIPHGTYRALALRAPAERDRARDVLGIADDAVVAALFGQLRPDKGIDDLLVAAGSVDGLVVVIAGEDAGGLASVEDLGRSPALRGRVVVREGHLSDAEIGCVLAAADVAVFPYRRASQSGAALLAYAFDTPAVAYPVGGLTELVEDGTTGWLVEDASPAALARTLRAVVRAGAAECARRGALGGRVIDERYDWSTVASRTAAVYRDAKHGSPNR